MFCVGCGAGMVEGARFCPNCGRELPSAESGAAVEAGPVRPETVRYAGFWRRCLAVVIDWTILGMVALFFSGIYLMMFSPEPGMEGIKLAVLSHNIFAMLLHWLYFTLMESSQLRATLGKMAIGIAVTDLHGGRISLSRANARYFAKFVSAFILGIGFIMAGLTARKQGLHDIMAGTLVVSRIGPSS